MMPVGDRVESGDPGTEEYDLGEVLAVGGDYVTVRWDVAATTYDGEDPAELRVVKRWVVTHLVASMPAGSPPAEKAIELEAPDSATAVFRATQRLLELELEIVGLNVEHEAL